VDEAQPRFITRQSSRVIGER